MRKKKLRARGCLTFILVLLSIIVVLLWGKGLVNEVFFPRDYENYVREACEQYGIDPWLVMAMIREESNFDATATSSVGACGLMQLMPDTAAWVIDQAGFDIETEQALFDPYWNIAIGVWYLNWLTDTYYNGDHLSASLAAYNAGHSNVDSWLSDGIWDGTVEHISDIPFSETRKYVQYIYKSYNIYLKLYG